MTVSLLAGQPHAADDEVARAGASDGKNLGSGAEDELADVLEEERDADRRDQRASAAARGAPAGRRSRSMSTPSAAQTSIAPSITSDAPTTKRRLVRRRSLRER